MDFVISFLFIISLCLGGWAQRDKQLYCEVCRVMVDEIDWIIGQVDPKKTLQTGSFRVDPQGNQNIKDVPYARSETHLTEVIEEVCSKMKDYAQTKTDDGRKRLVRTNARNGKRLSLKNISLNRDVQKTLEFYCDTLIEEHEEDIIGIFKKENLPKKDRIICGEISVACTEKDLNEPLETLKAEEIDEDEEEDEEEEEEEIDGGGDGENTDAAEEQKLTEKEEL